MESIQSCCHFNSTESIQSCCHFNSTGSILSCCYFNSPRAYSHVGISAHFLKHIVHIAISVRPGTHLHLSQLKHAKVKCTAHGHKGRNNITTFRGDKHYNISLKTFPGDVWSRTAGSGNCKSPRSNRHVPLHLNNCLPLQWCCNIVTWGLNGFIQFEIKCLS